MRPYSYDIRIRVLHAYQHAEQSQRQIARRFNVSLSFVRDLIRRYRDAGVARLLFNLPAAKADEVLPVLDRCAALMRQVRS